MIKRLIFYGFKSFADKQVVDFSKGITGVIGPNGCGKSNIVDGISFVFGAQSAKNLRGGKMEDVIFNGSDQRKPRDYAEVTVVLDNRDGYFSKINMDEVSVTRRVFRKGGSEYFINDEATRLKDVHDLFMDTGVGSDSYSIIGQGQIGKILSTKLEERRAIFEEASGIVKLRQQKEQTEKRLTEVDSNLVRIEDIVAEIEKQLKPLKKQSEKAQEFNEYNEKLQSLEMQYLLNEYDKIQAKIDSETLAFDELKRALEEQVIVISEEDSILSSSKTTYQKKNDELFQIQSEASNVKEEQEKLNGFINLNNERIENAHKQIKDIDDNLREIEEKHSISTEDFRSKQTRLDSISSIIKDKTTEIEQSTLNIEKLENDKMFLNNEIEHTRKLSIDEYNAFNQKKFEFEQLENKIGSLTDELKELDGKSVELKNSKKEITNEKNSLEIVVNNLQKDFSELQISYQNKTKELKTTKDKFNETLVSLQKSESELVKHNSKLEQIENFLENNESFYDGVKEILKLKKSNKIEGVYGAIAEIIEVEKKFETAIESLLQGAMQFLVTDNDSVAKKSIEYLKHNKLGKATFLPLNMANPSSFNKEEWTKINSFDGINFAITTISYDDEFEPILKSLLGRSIIADNLDIAVEFSKKHNIRCKISTLDGEIVQSGSLTGGANKNQKTSFFTKKRELEETKIICEKLSKTVDNLKVENKKLEEMCQFLYSEVERLNTEIEQKRSVLIEKQQTLDDVANRFERIIEKNQELDIKEQEVKLNLSESKKISVKLRFSIESLEKSNFESNEKLNNLNEQLKFIEADLEKVKESKTEIMMLINRLREEEKQIISYLDDFNNDNDSLEEKINRLHSKKEEEINKISELTNHGEQLQMQLVSLKEKMNEFNINIENLYNANQSLLSEINSLEQTIKEKREIKEKTEKEINQKEVYLSRKQTEKTNILNRLFEIYEIVEHDLPSYERIEIDMVGSKKEITELKKKIASLGSINHTAIEEYERLSERYSNEKSQLDDVKEAKNDLLMLINNVKDEMISRFTSTFDDIAHKFSSIFVELFEGGRAKISLENPKEPLNSAIEIIAQPPGKRPQSINSLSGGEKAFTAVALIFAIISSKPSPFVILDEVDAPLDDANVARFAYYLKKFSDKSQFIVITHRKGTMMITDYIHGVTQQERGVSIVFPHTLEEIQQKTS